MKYKAWLSRPGSAVPRSTQLMRNWREKRYAGLEERRRQRAAALVSGFNTEMHIADDGIATNSNLESCNIEVEASAETSSDEVNEPEIHNSDGVLEASTSEANNVGREDEPMVSSDTDTDTDSDTTKDYENDIDEPLFDQFQDRETETLCSHTQCTSDDVLIMTLALASRHKLTYVAVEDILSMFNTVFGEKKVKATKYTFMKRLSMQDEDLEIKYHHFCAACNVYIEKSAGPDSDGDSGPDSDNICPICKINVTSLKSPTYFASIPFDNQLKKLVSNESIASMLLNYRFNRKRTENCVSDIYDGSEYTKLSAPGGVLSSPQNLSISFFVDGVPLGKAKKSLWPIYVSINELPPEVRRKNILLVGLYYGSRDPNQAVFLKPFVDELNKLSSVGFNWSYKGQVMNSKVVPLVAVADSVARCQLLNLQSFNAYYGCTFCYQTTVKTTKKLKFVIPDSRVELRTTETYLSDLQEVTKRRHYLVEKKRQYRGVKGASSLADLQYFDLFKGFVVDSMHCILLGVCKTYFELIFEQERRDFWVFLKENVRYSIEDVFKVIDSRLKSIQPPTSIARTPRDMKDYGNWKANEWRSWLLYYCIPCLQGLLKTKHLAHIAMLCKGYHLLMQKSISQSEIFEAHNLFKLFMFHYQKYFGEEFMYYNIHLLMHISKGVSMWGPLWTHNAFMYEAYNRNLLQLSKSPFQVVKEISKRYLIMRELPRLIVRFTSCDNILLFCQNMLEKNLVRYKRSDSCILLGAKKQCDLDHDERMLLVEKSVDVASAHLYDKVLLKGLRISTAQFSQNKLHNDSVVNLNCGRTCEVIAIVSVEDTVKLLVKNLVPKCNSVLKRRRLGIDICHIKSMESYGSLDLVDPNNVVSQCVFMDTKEGKFYGEIGIGLLLGD